MNLRALRTFVTTVDSGGLARASEKLNLSQPAASRQIGVLEAELGVQLFHRIGRGLQLSPEGEALLRQSRRLLADAEAIAERARALKGGSSGILRIAGTPHVIGGVLARFLPHFAARHPDVEIQLLEGGATRQPGRLEDGEVHLALMPSGDERFAGRLLYPVHGVAAVHDGHRLGERPVLDVAALSGEPILLLRREFGSRAWFDRACEIAHAKPVVRLESAAPQTLVELAASGYGIAILPSTVAIHAEPVRLLPLVQRGASLGRWSMIAWSPQRALPRYAEWFVEEFVAHISHAPPGRSHLHHAPPIPRPAHPHS